MKVLQEWAAVAVLVLTIVASAAWASTQTNARIDRLAERVGAIEVAVAVHGQRLDHIETLLGLALSAQENNADD